MPFHHYDNIFELGYPHGSKEQTLQPSTLLAKQSICHSYPEEIQDLT
jgi:hypothetical protein